MWPFEEQDTKSLLSSLKKPFLCSGISWPIEPCLPNHFEDITIDSAGSLILFLTILVQSAHILKVEPNFWLVKKSSWSENRINHHESSWIVTRSSIVSSLDFVSLVIVKHFFSERRKKGRKNDSWERNWSINATLIRRANVKVLYFFGNVSLQCYYFVGLWRV